MPALRPSLAALLALLATPLAAQDAAQPAAARSAMERQDIRAQLMPRQFTVIAAEIGAKISRLPVAEGGAFKAGQLLVQFDCSMQQAQLQKARAEQSAAEHTFTANRRLLELNSIGQLDVDLARAALAKANAEVGAQQAVLSKCSVAAPFAGRIAEQKVREQQYVQPGQPLLDILDDSVLELEFLVPSAWLGWLKPGVRFQVDIDETRKSYPAKFTRIGARVDPVSQSVKVAAAIDGRFPELITGMSGRVRITPP
ncbi:efflux RND transporter periplasmic adaptor subunit [Azoarcus olearius]|uniref:HlyD family secretion protein n=1 Tax=Azoarcus sp. (strain BH72) TaxID=418699 RepID=A1K8L7_AZOSB|nr:efflux RND transporter periplasmic adaptor subunit [Azoarcus olearius]CAL95172.1 HlyD family secretion protein [Azoarcus olearius]